MVYCNCLDKFSRQETQFKESKRGKHCDKMKERKMAAKGHDIKDMGRKEEHLQRHETKGPLSKE